MKHRRDKKPIREIEIRGNFSGERSPYWEFVKAHQFADEDGQVREEAIANPDVLSEDDNVFRSPVDPEERAFKLKVVQEIIPTLSKQQQKLLILCGPRGKSIDKAAQELHITKRTAQVFLERAREKLIRGYQSRRAQAILKGEL